MNQYGEIHETIDIDCFLTGGQVSQYSTLDPDTINYMSFFIVKRDDQLKIALRTEGVFQNKGCVTYEVIDRVDEEKGCYRFEICLKASTTHLKMIPTHPGRHTNLIKTGASQQRIQLPADEGISPGSFLKFDLALDRPVGVFTVRIKVGGPVVSFDYSHRSARLDQFFQNGKGLLGIWQMLQNEADKQVVECPGFV